jgi:hypothetical protein
VAHARRREIVREWHRLNEPAQNHETGTKATCSYGKLARFLKDVISKDFLQFP